MHFTNYNEKYYEAVCGFLIELNRPDKNHINWNWARFEWMAEHPEFDKSAVGSIGLWLDGERVVGAAIYDMYFGEGFCGVLPGYEALYPEVLDYAYKALRDEGGIGIAICDDDRAEIEAAENAGFAVNDQTETVMSLPLDRDFSSELSAELHIEQLDPAEKPYDFQWILWRGFDHGTDKEEFEREDKIVPQLRRHLNPQLSLAAVDAAGEAVGYCCLWFSEKTDYAYVEPVCTAPSYRGKGVAKALLHEAFGRVKRLGARKAYVISDAAFYKKLGFTVDKHFTFYRKA
jgi:GNAT superfamily N-acetyltransferase